MEYHKLVRDKIPKIIAQNGGCAHIRQLSQEEYIAALETKLDEEVGEYHRDHNIEELADILEVVFSLSAAIGSREALMEAYQKKHNSRGGFENRIFLISTED